MATRIEALNIGQMLRKHVKKHRLFQSRWARQQGVTPKTIATYLKNPGMRVDTLFLICQVLEYNFFTEIAQQLPAELPPVIIHDSEQQLEAMKQENEQLKLQVVTLEKALRWVSGK